MKSPMKGIFLMMTIMLMCCSINSYERDSIKKRSVHRRQRPRQLRNRFEALRRQSLLQQSLDPEWSRLFVPEVPRAEDVDCNIEIEVTEIIGGRCVRLGGVGRLAVCQSGMYLDVHNDVCQHILAERDMNEQLPEMSAQQSDQESQFSQNVAQNGVSASSVAENGVPVGENVFTERQQVANSD